MDHEFLSRAFQLVGVLSQGQFLSVAQMAERTDMHPRRVYRLLESFPRLGLTLEKSRHSYRISASAPFLKQVTALLHFTTDEAVTLLQILEAVPNGSVQARLLREKLTRSTTERILLPPDVDEATGRNIRQVFEAMQLEHAVVLKGYSSANSQKRDRFVEPYAFLPGNRDVRCFEIDTQTNKTFNLARAESVEIVDIRWSGQAHYQPPIVDLFHFSGEHTTHVVLRLGVLAKSVLLEEYPQAEKLLTAEDKTHWRMEGDFCSMKGIGRFVVGLLEDIEIIDAPELEAYLSDYLQRATLRLSPKSDQKS